MNRLLKSIRVLIDTLMAIIIIVGILFIVLFFIGIKPFVVLTGSMEPVVPTGSLSFINNNIKFEDIKPNDIIAFTMPGGENVTHRAISIGEDGIQTKGDANAVADGIIVTKQNYLGKNVFSIPKVGYIVAKVQTKRGRIILGTMIIMFILATILLGEPKKKKQPKEEVAQ